MRRTNLEGSWKVDNKTTAQLVNLTEQISEVAANSCHDEHWEEAVCSNTQADAAAAAQLEIEAPISEIAWGKRTKSQNHG